MKAKRNTKNRTNGRYHGAGIQKQRQKSENYLHNKLVRAVTAISQNDNIKVSENIFNRLVAMMPNTEKQHEQSMLLRRLLRTLLSIHNQGHIDLGEEYVNVSRLVRETKGLRPRAHNEGVARLEQIFAIGKFVAQQSKAQRTKKKLRRSNLKENMGKVVNG